MSKARRFVNEFNITVDLLKTLMPSQAGVIDNVFYDAKSYVLSFQGKICACSFIKSPVMNG